jgi:sterol desaturase/sphingolipid hydroxylase (fatty acid hydroxylase superfamily)
VINGPEAHRWHHAADPEALNLNFATKLALWDGLFGTAFLPEGRKPTGYGLTDVAFPRGYVRQHLFAFRPFSPRQRDCSHRTPARTAGDAREGLIA